MSKIGFKFAFDRTGQIVEKQISSKQKLIPGIVIRARQMKKTVVVAVSRRKIIPIYRIDRIQTKKYMVHDQYEVCDIGDHVLLKQSRPFSKRKRYVIGQILRKEPGIAYLAQEPKYWSTKESDEIEKIKKYSEAVKKILDDGGIIEGYIPKEIREANLDKIEVEEFDTFSDESTRKIIRLRGSKEGQFYGKRFSKFKPSNDIHVDSRTVIDPNRFYEPYWELT
eukprot:TRINITY_DN1144_c1_g1_i1.p1 TRINITY_DN1144_c1_g1~~TRINITY_DN1144_c1_g1_i1.p1  ORF type:complete len:223 (+),score=102.74 TRINITY_DN1144_c1_g1_i1:105-773(+)